MNAGFDRYNLALPCPSIESCASLKINAMNAILLAAEKGVTHIRYSARAGLGWGPELQLLIEIFSVAPNHTLILSRQGRVRSRSRQLS